jgi:hypothetical protein
MTKYRSIGYRYLSFCWRSYRIGCEEAFQCWAIQFTDEQWGLLSDVDEELEGDVFPSSGDSRFCSGRNVDTDDEEEDEDEEVGECEEEIDDGGISSLVHNVLDRAIFQFIVSSIKTGVSGNVYMNPLLYFCAALGVR